MRAPVAVETMAPQADSALAEQPPEAPRLGSGWAKPRSEATCWRSRSPVCRLDQSLDLPPPLLPATDARKEGRGTAAIVAPAARSGEPAPSRTPPPSRRWPLTIATWGWEGIRRHRWSLDHCEKRREREEAGDQIRRRRHGVPPSLLAEKTRGRGRRWMRR